MSTSFFLNSQTVVETEAIFNYETMHSMMYECVCTRPTFSQLWSLKIPRTTLINYVNFAILLILRHVNCERAGREANLCSRFV